MSDAETKFAFDLKVTGRTVVPFKLWRLNPVSGVIVREMMFALPERNWRFDFANPDLKVALEIEGGIGRYGQGKSASVDELAPGGRAKARDYAKLHKASSTGTAMKSRHAGTEEGYEKDQQKYLWAAVNGWIVIHVTTRQVKNGEALQKLELVEFARMGYDLGDSKLELLWRMRK